MYALVMQKRRGPHEVPTVVDFTCLYTHLNDGIDAKWQQPPRTSPPCDVVCLSACWAHCWLWTRGTWVAREQARPR